MMMMMIIIIIIIIISVAIPNSHNLYWHYHREAPKVIKTCTKSESEHGN